MSSFFRPSFGSLPLNATASGDMLVSGNLVVDGVLTAAGVSGSGENNTASNVGDGSGVFKEKSGVDFRFKSLDATGIVLNAKDNLLELTGVAGPASSTDNAIPRFNGSGGGTLQNSSIIIDDSNNLSGVSSFTSTGNATFGNAATDFHQVSGSMDFSGSTSNLTINGAFISTGVHVLVVTASRDTECDDPKHAAYISGTLGVMCTVSASSFRGGDIRLDDNAFSYNKDTNLFKVEGPITAAAGLNPHSDGRQNAILIGRSGINEQGKSIAIGESPRVTNPYTNGIAIGTETLVDGAHGVAIGAEASASWSSVALGLEARATGSNDLDTGMIAIGLQCSSSSRNAIAIGGGSRSWERASIALGYKSVSLNEHTIAIGSDARALGIDSIALGHNATASSHAAIAIGYNTTASGGNSIAFGSGTVATDANTMVIGHTAQPMSVYISGNLNVCHGTSSFHYVSGCGNNNITVVSPISSSQLISASAFYGNGSGLTNLPVGTAGGSDTQIQFNDGGTLGGDSDLVYNKTSNVLTAVKLTASAHVSSSLVRATTITGSESSLGIAQATTISASTSIQTDLFFNGYFSASINSNTNIPANQYNFFNYSVSSSLALTASNPVAGASYVIMLRQDPVGGRVISFDPSTFKFPSGSVPSMSTGSNEIDIISGVSDGAAIYATADKKFS